MNIFLSIVIPTCNRDALLRECLSSLSEQLNSSVEVIVVNNGDNDSLQLDVCETPNLHILRTNPRIGASAARNAGARLAQGKLIAFLDDDDFWANDYISIVSNYFESYVVDMLLTNKVIFYSKSEIKSKYLKKFDSLVSIEDVFLKRYSIGGQAMVVTKESFLKVGGFNPEFKSSNDKALVMDYLLNKLVVRAYSGPVAYFRQHDSTSRLTDRPFRGAAKFYRKYFEHMTFKVKLYMFGKLALLLAIELRNKSLSVLKTTHH